MIEKEQKPFRYRHPMLATALVLSFGLWLCSAAQFGEHGRPHHRSAEIDLWADLMIMSTGLLIGSLILAWARTPRGRAAWLCQTCGYDRGGLASDTTACPECGTIPSK